MIVDTSALLAFFDRAEPEHLAVSAALEASDSPLVVSPYVLAEVDYLVSTRHGVPAELAVLDELAGGAWELPCLERTDVRAARDIIARYSDQRIGLADASIVVLAERFGTRTIATLDRRHFGILRTSTGEALIIVP